MEPHRAPKCVRDVAVVTGSRADYGLLHPLLRLLRQDPDLTFHLIVCGAHLAPEFGSTKHLIEEDGFQIDAEVEMLVSGDTPSATAKSVGLGCIGFAQCFSRLKPDLLLLLGDRFEILAAAQAALFARIPVAHLHGGEATEGAVDEAIRHAVTKMAHVHFVAAEPFRRRVLQMGEDPRHVHMVGALGLDNIVALEPMSRERVEERLGVSLSSRSVFLVTYHPETLGSTSPTGTLGNLFEVLGHWRDAAVIVTYANSDSQGRVLNAAIRDYAASDPARIVARPSLGQDLYLNVLRLSDCVIGNSSSGLLEAPSFGVPTVNIGSRQDGRLKADSVIDCAADAGSISAALRTALSKDFQERARSVTNPYGDGATAPRIVSWLKRTNLHNLVVKRFHPYSDGGAEDLAANSRNGQGHPMPGSEQ